MLTGDFALAAFGDFVFFGDFAFNIEPGDFGFSGDLAVLGDLTFLDDCGDFEDGLSINFAVEALGDFGFSGDFAESASFSLRFDELITEDSANCGGGGSGGVLLLVNTFAGICVNCMLSSNLMGVGGGESELPNGLLESRSGSSIL